MSLHSLLSELGTRSQFLAAQVAAGISEKEIQRSQAAAVSSSLRNHSALSVEDATILTKAIKDGPWDAEAREALAMEENMEGRGRKAAMEQPTG